MTAALRSAARSALPRGPSSVTAAACVAALAVTACAGERSSTEPDPVIERVVVTPVSATLTAVGEVRQLAASASYSDGSSSAAVAFTWSSSRDSIATVSSSGAVTARANGIATIAAAAGSVVGTATVTVAQLVATVDVVPTSALLAALEDTVRLQASAADANGHPAPATFSWSSADESVVRVDAEGLVTAEGNGSAEVRASAGQVTGASLLEVDQEPTGLAFAREPGYALPDVAMTYGFDVEVQDRLGHRVEDATPVVSVTLTTGPGSGALSGTPTATAVDGVASFDDLTIDEPGRGYVLTATAPGLEPGASRPFHVSTLALVGLFDADSVAFVETETHSVVAKVGVGTGPASIAVSPDGARAYVSNGRLGTVSVLETGAARVVATIDNRHPLLADIELGVDPTRAYVLRPTIPGSVRVIDTTIDAIVDSIGVGDGPQGLTLLPDGSKGYTANTFSDDVSVFRLADGALLKTIPLVSDGRGVAATPDGATAYVVTATTLQAIEVATDSIVGSISVTGNILEIEIEPGGAFAYVPTWRSGVRIVDLTAGTETGSVDLGFGQGASAAFSSDGSLAYVGDFDRDVLYAVDTSTHTWLAAVALTSPAGVVVTPYPPP